MSRYIDAEFCEDFFDRWESRVKNAEPVTIDVVQNTRTLLREAPSIDIVRCKDCRHCHYEQVDDIFYCDVTYHRFYFDNHYCSYGEKETDHE